MMKWFLNLLTGGLLDKGLDAFKIWAANRNERIRIEREMFGDIVQHEIYAKMAARDVLLAEQGWWVTRMIRPLFAYPLIIYTWAHVADAIYFHTGDIWPLPDYLQEWYGWIIAAFFLMRPIEKATRSAAASVRERVETWLSNKVGGRKK